jgi:hypothetical protein
MTGWIRIKTKKREYIIVIACASIVLFLIHPWLCSAYPNKCTLTNLNTSPSIYASSILAKPDSLHVATIENSVNFSNDFISAVQSGSTNMSKIILASNPIGKSVKIDIRIDNVTEGFWGWSLPTISWSPSVMNLTSVQEGNFLTDKTGATALFIGDSPLLWNNTGGEIDGGLAEALSSAATSVDSSGVLATLTFKITNYGNSSVTIAGAYTIASFNEANPNLNPPTEIPCYNATVAAIATGSSTLRFPIWIIALLVIIPVVGFVAYVWNKKLERLLLHRSRNLFLYRLTKLWFLLVSK